MLEFIQGLGSKVFQFFSTKFGSETKRPRSDSLCDEVSVISPAKRSRLDMDRHDDLFHSGSVRTSRQFSQLSSYNKESFEYNFDNRAFETLNSSQSVGREASDHGCVGMTGGGFNFTSARRDLQDVTSFQFTTKANSEKLKFQGSPFPHGSKNTNRNHLNIQVQPMMANGRADIAKLNGVSEAKNRSLFDSILGDNNITRGFKSIDTKRRKRLTAKQCFRLDEKYKYQELLNRHVSHHSATPLLPAYSIERHVRPDARHHVSKVATDASERSDGFARSRFNESISTDDFCRRINGIKSMLASVTSSERGQLSAALPEWPRSDVERRRSENTLPERTLERLQRMRFQPMKVLPTNDFSLMSTEARVASVKEPLDSGETPRMSGSQMASLQSLNREKKTYDSEIVIFESPFPTSVFSERLSTLKDSSSSSSSSLKKSAIPEMFERALKQSQYANKEFLDKINSKTEADFAKQSIVEKETMVKYYKEEREKCENSLISKMQNLMRATARIPIPLEEVYVPETPEEEILEIPDEDEEEQEEEEEEEEEDDVEEISDEFPELTVEQDSLVDRALVPTPPDQVLVEEFRLQLTRRDFATLARLNWLNDEVINFYFNLIMKRSEGQGFPKSYVFSTFFYPKVHKEGHKAVRRWTKAIDLFTYDYILIPVHLDNHWCLAVVDFRKKEIRYYDSMGMSNSSCLQTLKKYLSEEHKIKREKDFDWLGWQFISVKDIPQQMNGSDCGMFACKFAEYVSRDAPITFDQRHMPYFRRRMVFEILTKKLM